MLEEKNLRLSQSTFCGVTHRFPARRTGEKKKSALWGGFPAEIPAERGSIEELGKNFEKKKLKDGNELGGQRSSTVRITFRGAEDQPVEKQMRKRGRVTKSPNQRREGQGLHLALKQTTQNPADDRRTFQK